MEASKEIVSAVHEILKNMAQAYLDKIWKV